MNAPLEQRKIQNNLESDREKMQTLWNQMYSCGVELYVDGELVSPVEAAARTVCENSPYMADYVVGDNGILSEVRFDKVCYR